MAPNVPMHVHNCFSMAEQSGLARIIWRVSNLCSEAERVIHARLCCLVCISSCSRETAPGKLLPSPKEPIADPQPKIYHLVGRVLLCTSKETIMTLHGYSQQ